MCAILTAINCQQYVKSTNDLQKDLTERLFHCQLIATKEWANNAHRISGNNQAFRRPRRDGRLRAFKKGAFHIAVDLGVPIVPTWIQGTLDVIPPDQWKASTGQKVTVAYGEPIETKGRTIADLLVEVRAAMLKLAHDCGAPADVDAA